MSKLLWTQKTVLLQGGGRECGGGCVCVWGGGGGGGSSFKTLAWFQILLESFSGFKEAV